ncbi:carboxymuconolactone decarboxylase family protein [bacterium]|nr:carboxymuconolactone decarboxylase family protein [bacterium]
MNQSLSIDHQLALGLLSAAMVCQRDDLVQNLIVSLREDGVKRTVLHEIILQAYLHDGYATALEGVNLLQHVWPVEANHDIESYADWERWHSRGEVLFRTIYGSVADRVREGVAEASPELSSWMLHEGYGKVLARPGVDTVTRELCTVAVLIMKHRPKQLFSHLRGAIRVGIDVNTLRNLIQSIEKELGDGEHLNLAKNLVEKLTI